MGCPSEVYLNSTLTFTTCVHDPSTGGLIDADSLPSYRIYEEGISTAILSGQMNRFDNGFTQGFYEKTIVCSAANGFAGGKIYSIYISGAVAGILGGISFGFRVLEGVVVADILPAEISQMVETLLKFDLSTITGEARRSVINALRFLLNKWTIVGGTLTVMKEDDSTPAWDASVSATYSTDGVSGVDPV